MPKRPHGRPVSFLGVDGEAINGKYVMLCCSDGTYVEDMEGLSTEACFEFLLGLKRKYPHHVIVGFGWTYDANMMLKGKPPHMHRTLAEQIWKDRSCCIVVPGGAIYEVTWIPSKLLAIQSDVRAEVQDVFGFFQTRFLVALKDWKIPDVDGAFERIEAGKLNRGSFTPEEVESIRQYCITECEMLVELCEALQDAFRATGLHVRKWIGAGAAGQALIQKYGVLEHHTPDYALKPEIHEAVMSAYYGGRFEMFRQGYFETCSNYDIISAYPYECLSLPTLYGSWEKRTKYDAKAEYALWLCSWELPGERKVMPFPYRRKGRIYYPSIGKGWYWAAEVRAARLLHPEIRIEGGYVYKPSSDVKPFAFLLDVWEKRKEAKAKGLASQKAYKLEMNSLYGKLAQGRGFQGKVPRQRSFVWAGMITSGTRAKLLLMLKGQADNVIATATDGIFFEHDPEYPVGTELGELEGNTFADFYQIANGIYYSPNTKLRTRGHHPGELDWDLITAIWDEEKINGAYRYNARRFIGLGNALMRKDFGLWCEWVESERSIHMAQWLRKYLDAEEDTSLLLGEFEGDNVSWYPPMETLTLGDSYRPKTDIFSNQSEAERNAVLKYIELLDQPDIMIDN